LRRGAVESRVLGIARKTRRLGAGTPLTHAEQHRRRHHCGDLSNPENARLKEINSSRKLMTDREVTRVKAWQKAD